MLIVLLAFLATIIFSWGMGGFQEKDQTEQGVIGKINGQKIMYRNFARALEMEYDNYRETNNVEEINEYQREQLRNKVWYDIVQELLFAEEIEKKGIVATPDEVVFQLRYNPPEFLRTNEQFMTEGKFDIQKYHQALNNPQNYQSWIPVENYLSQMIPRQKLGQYILSTVRISPSEIQYNYKIKNTSMNARFIHFDPKNLTDAETVVTETEIKSYYKEHEDEFQVPEQRKLSYVVFDLVPSYQDSMQTRQEALDIIKQLKNGADFEEMASLYSEDEGSTANGGDLGFFGKGQMVKPFEEAAFNADEGDIVGPVNSQFGAHIIQVLDKKTKNGEPQVRARHILLKYTRSHETFDRISETAKDFSESAQGMTVKEFKEFALSLNYQVETSPFFKEGTVIPGIGFNNRFIKLVFNNKLKWVSQPLHNEEKYFILQVADIQEAHTDSLHNVEEEIRKNLIREKRMAVVAGKCQNAYQLIENGETFEAVAQKYNLEIFETGKFTIDRYVQRVGRDFAFTGAAYQLAINDISQPVKGKNGYYLIKLIDKSEFSDEELAALALEDKTQKLQEKQQTAYMKWYKILEEKHEIKDYRYLYF